VRAQHYFKDELNITTNTLRKKSMSKRISLEFLEKTKYKHLTPSPQTQGIKQPPLEAPPNKTLPIFDLPKPTDITINPITLRESIEKRTSI